MDAVQRAHAAAVVVPGGAGGIFRGSGVFEDVERIVDLRGDVVEIVVVVEEQDLGLEAGGGERRTDSVAQEVALLLPRHIQRHRIAPVQGLVLQGDRINGITPFFHFPDPEGEVIRIFLVADGIQTAGGPAVERRAAVVVHLHPFRTAPRRSDDLDLRIDGEDLVEDREQILLVERMDGEIVEPLLVAPGKLVEREIGAADAHADQRRAQPLLAAEHFGQELLAVGFRHPEQIEATGLRDGETEALDRLEGLARQQDAEIALFGRFQRRAALLEAEAGRIGRIHLDGALFGHGVGRNRLIAGERRAKSGQKQKSDSRFHYRFF